MPKILPGMVCRMAETLTHRSPYNEPMIQHHINSQAKRIHFVQKLTNNYENIHSAHLSSLEIYLKKHAWKRNINVRDVNQMQA